MTDGVNFKNKHDTNICTYNLENGRSQHIHRFNQSEVRAHVMNITEALCNIHPYMSLHLHLLKIFCMT